MSNPLPRPSTSLSVNAMRTAPVTAISTQLPNAARVPSSARAPETVPNPAPLPLEAWTEVPLTNDVSSEAQRHRRPENVSRAFSRNSLTTSSFQRPMCRICHSYRGFVSGNSVCVSAGATGQRPPSSASTLPPARSNASVLSSPPSTISGQTTEDQDEEGGRPRDLGRLIAPCLCDGSLKYVHEVCVQQWISVSHSTKCELCHFPFYMKSYTKPLSKVSL
ncbi:unnamed protein product [Schistocephalus solidus]|uniref:RING-CH-type domain-containing protein n=1 Tax=Schistocephalus solidus TaxID=70667 RepID=A0A183T8A2_SCHSO|nr:unnamed protein product [Schistocephalus solidus]